MSPVYIRWYILSHTAYSFKVGILCIYMQWQGWDGCLYCIQGNVVSWLMHCTVCKEGIVWYVQNTGVWEVSHVSCVHTVTYSWCVLHVEDQKLFTAKGNQTSHAQHAGRGIRPDVYYICMGSQNWHVDFFYWKHIY